MKLADAIKGHLLDLKISGATEKHIHEVKRELERFRSWAQGQEVLQLEDASYIVLKLYISFLQDLALQPHFGEESSTALDMGTFGACLMTAPPHRPAQPRLLRWHNRPEEVA